MKVEGGVSATRAKTWCPYPVHYLMLTPNLEARPCCRFDPTVNGEQVVLDSVRDIQKVFESQYFSKIRKGLANDEIVKGCEKCFDEDWSKIPSLRTKTIYEQSLPLDENVRLAAMEIGVGRLCNLKCRTCGSQYSSMWDKDEQLLGKSRADYSKQKGLDLENFPEEIFATLKEVKITGGEPFISKSFKMFIDRFHRSGFSGDCEIEIFTNGTILPDQHFLNSLASFKNVRISLSIDSTEKKNDYIRSPSRWSRLVENFKLWQEWSNSPGRSIWIANTLCIYNILDSFSFLDWSESFFGANSKVVFQVLHGPPYLAIGNMPKKLKRKIGEQLEKQLVGEFAYLNVDKHEKNIKKILNTLNIHESYSDRLPQKIMAFVNGGGDDRYYLREFLRETEKLDEIRQENFYKTFPILGDLIKESL